LLKDENGNPVMAYGSEQNFTERMILKENYENEIRRFRTNEENSIYRTHASLTANTVIESIPSPKNGAGVGNYDEIISKYIFKDVVTLKGDVLKEILERNACIAAYARGERELVVEYKWPGSGDWKWVRANINLIQNPFNNDIELFLYCADDTSNRMQSMVVERLSTTAYDGIAVINVRDGSYVMQSEHGVIENKTYDSYEDRIGRIIRDKIKDEEKEDVRVAFEMPGIIEDINNKGMCIRNTCEYNDEGVGEYKMRQFSWLDEDKKFTSCRSSLLI